MDSLDATGITDKGTKALLSMTGLKNLNLYHTVVTEKGMLELRAALARTIDGIHKAVELKEGRPPNVQPGPPCRWCPVSEDCPAGMAFLSDQDEPDF